MLIKKTTLANGKKVSERQFRKITHKAFQEIFCKMTSEKMKLFDSTKITIDTTTNLVNYYIKALFISKFPQKSAI